MRALNTAARDEQAEKREASASTWIRLHGPDLDTATVSWRSPDGREGEGRLAAAAAACQGALVDVIVPGECVLLTSAPMPKTGASQLRQAFPFAVEEYLAEDVEQLHVALAPWPRGRGAGDPVHGAVVSHALMRHWTEGLRAAGLRLRHLVPDTLCLPLPDQADAVDADVGEPGASEPWTLWLEADRFVLRTGRYAGLAGERTLLDPVIGAAGAAAHDQTQRVRWCEGRSIQASEYEPTDVDGVQFERATGEDACDGDAALAVERAAGLDLLQEPYRPDVARTGGLRAWLWPAVLVWVLVGANLAAVVIDHVRLSARHSALQHDITALYRKTFPQDQRIVDARVQMEQHLKTLQVAGRRGDTFVDLLAALGNAVRAEPALTIDAVSYRDGRLGVQLDAPRVALVESLRDRLGRDGRLRTHIESIDAGQDDQGGGQGGTRVRLSIEEGGS